MRLQKCVLWHAWLTEPLVARADLHWLGRHPDHCRLCGCVLHSVGRVLTAEEHDLPSGTGQSPVNAMRCRWAGVHEVSGQRMGWASAESTYFSVTLASHAMVGLRLRHKRVSHCHLLACRTAASFMFALFDFRQMQRWRPTRNDLGYTACNCPWTIGM